NERRIDFQVIQVLLPVTPFVRAKERSALNPHLLGPTPSVNVRSNKFVERGKSLRIIRISKDLFDLAKNVSSYLLDVVDANSIARNAGQPDKLGRKVGRIFEENLRLDACSP